MEVKIVKPIDSNLARHINYYYILRQSAKNDNSNYYCFPNSTSMISLIKNVDCTFSKTKAIFASHNEETISSYLITPFKKPMNIQYEGEIFEISISFKPLGINHFINTNLDSFKKGQFNHFVPDLAYLKGLKHIFSLNNETLILAELEKFLLSRMVNFEHPFLYYVVNSLTDDISVTFVELCETLKVSQKTMIKHFSVHLNLKPAEFKRILRFRLALDKKTDEKIEGSLTEISNQAHFFIQR